MWGLISLTLVAAVLGQLFMWFAPEQFSNKRQFAGTLNSADLAGVRNAQRAIANAWAGTKGRRASVRFVDAEHVVKIADKR